MTLDDAASQRQHASDLADADVVKWDRENEESPWPMSWRIEDAIAEEREACAKLVESMAPTEYVQRIAAAIRARR